MNTPEPEDNIHKDHVFRLQFKNHVYFFRAESEYTFERYLGDTYLCFILKRTERMYVLCTAEFCCICFSHGLKENIDTHTQRSSRNIFL